MTSPIFVYVNMSSVYAHNAFARNIYIIEAGKPQIYIGCIYPSTPNHWIAYSVYRSPFYIDSVTTSLEDGIEAIKKLCQLPYIFIEQKELEKLLLLQ